MEQHVIYNDTLRCDSPVSSEEEEEEEEGKKLFLLL